MFYGLGLYGFSVFLGLGFTSALSVGGIRSVEVQGVEEIWECGA